MCSSDFVSKNNFFYTVAEDILSLPKGIKQLLAVVTCFMLFVGFFFLGGSYECFQFVFGVVVVFFLPFFSMIFLFSDFSWHPPTTTDRCHYNIM